MSTPAAVRVWESYLAVYKRIWRSNVLGSFLQPLLYLLGMGVGVGALVDRGTEATQLLGGVDYIMFLAPALVATSTMMVLGQEALWPTLDGFMWSHAYVAMTSTPLEPAQVVAGHTLWHATRGAITAGGVAVILALFPDTRDWGLIATVPFAVLTGLAFALPIAAWTSTRESDISFPMIMRFGLVPTFLFAGAFYPVEQLPDWLEPVAWLTPLFHGVELCRGVVLDTLGAGDLALHVGALGVYIVGGYLLCRRTFTRRLFA